MSESYTSPSGRVRRSGAPDAAARDAAEQLELVKRMRQVEQSILARNPESDVVPTLERVQAVMELLGDPQRSFPVIHLTGTNGKTTTTRVVEAILREHGLTTGRFTSPHLHDIRERIAIGGEPISAERFLAAYDDVAPYLDIVDARSQAAGAPRLTYFEVVVCVAYAAFADAPVDVAVVEVGLGGRWDATNVADGQVAVVTPIGIDHERFLGDTVEAIAEEKAGIVKPGATAVVAEQERDALEVLQERCDQVGAELRYQGDTYEVLAREVAVGGQLVSVRGLAGVYDDLFLPLHGEHQAQNAATAVAAVEAFLGGGQQPLDVEVLRAGLAAATSPGRLEIVRRSPTVLVDAAHNPHGAAALRRALAESFTFTRVVGVVACFVDKDAAGILEQLEPALDEIVCTRTSSHRAMRPADLGRVAEEIFGPGRVTVVDDLPDAIEKAAELAETDNVAGGVGAGVVATGSITMAAEVRMLLGVTTA